jgi:hypothetical protein
MYVLSLLLGGLPEGLPAERTFGELEHAYAFVAIIRYGDFPGFFRIAQ